MDLPLPLPNGAGARPSRGPAIPDPPGTGAPPTPSAAARVLSGQGQPSPDGKAADLAAGTLAAPAQSGAAPAGEPPVEDRFAAAFAGLTEAPSSEPEIARDRAPVPLPPQVIAEPSETATPDIEVAKQPAPAAPERPVPQPTTEAPLARHAVPKVATDAAVPRDQVPPVVAPASEQAVKPAEHGATSDEAAVQRPGVPKTVAPTAVSPSPAAPEAAQEAIPAPQAAPVDPEEARPSAAPNRPPPAPNPNPVQTGQITPVATATDQVARLEVARHSPLPDLSPASAPEQSMDQQAPRKDAASAPADTADAPRVQPGARPVRADRIDVPMSENASRSAQSQPSAARTQSVPSAAAQPPLAAVESSQSRAPLPSAKPSAEPGVPEVDLPARAQSQHIAAPSSARTWPEDAKVVVRTQTPQEAATAVARPAAASGGIGAGLFEAAASRGQTAEQKPQPLAQAAKSRAPIETPSHIGGGSSPDQPSLDPPRPRRGPIAPSVDTTAPPQPLIQSTQVAEARAPNAGGTAKVAAPLTTQQPTPPTGQVESSVSLAPIEAPTALEPAASLDRPVEGEATRVGRAAFHAEVSPGVSAPTVSESRSVTTVSTGAAANTPNDIARSTGQQIATVVIAQSGPARIELQLDPPELGRVDIDLDITDQGLRATITSERSTTGELLRRHGDVLLQQFQDAGFADIDLRFGQSRREGGEAGSSKPERTGDLQAPDLTETTSRAAAPRPDGADRIDLRL